MKTKVHVMNFSFSPDWENNFDFMNPDDWTMMLDACPQVISVSLSGDDSWRKLCRRKVVEYMMKYWEDSEGWETALQWAARVTWTRVQKQVDEKTGLTSEFYTASLDGEVQAIMVLSEREAD